MICDKQLSNLLYAFKTLLIFGIVYIHHPIFTIAGAPDAWQEKTFLLLSPNSFVPGFFVVSGYFLFLKFDGTLQSYLKILKSRMRTLLVPYILWNLLVWGIYFFGPKLPGISVFFEDGKFHCDSLFSWVNVIFGITQDPLAFQFWFIRDLMVLIVLLPLIYLLLKRFDVALLLVLGALTVLNLPSFLSPLFFLVCGGILTRYLSLSDIQFKNPRLQFLALSFVVCSILRVVFGLNQLAGLLTILGIPFWFCMTEELVKNKLIRNFLEYCAPMAFFIFAAHGIIIVFLRKAWLKVLPVNSFFLTLGFLILPVICILICILTINIFSRLTPGILSWFCGGRIAAPPPERETKPMSALR